MIVFVTMRIKTRDCDNAVFPDYSDLPGFDKEHVEL
jgi:hypothetical protein